MTKKDIDQFIDELKKKKNSVVRQKGSKTNPTRGLNYRYSGVSHAPSISVEHAGATDLYEFEKNYAASKMNDLIAKWILFSIKARSLSGQFYLVVSKKDQSKFAKVIKEKLLNIELLTLD